MVSGKSGTYQGFGRGWFTPTALETGVFAQPKGETIGLFLSPLGITYDLNMIFLIYNASIKSRFFVFDVFPLIA